MDDLLRFVQARMNDDEAFMRTAIRLRDCGAVTASPAATEGAFAIMDVIADDPDTVEAITMFTRTGVRAPGEAERVLAEVESKRQMIEWLEGVDQDAPVLESALQYLALPYAVHPDYNEAWRP